MTVFSLEVASWKPALAAVAAHGMTDLDTMEWVPHYAMWMVLPMPSCAVTGMFCAYSFVHFAEDGGVWVSALAHLGALVVGLRRGPDAAFKAMLLYLLMWHTPCHYWRHWKRGSRRGVLLAAASTLIGVLGRHRIPNRLPFNNCLQRIVIAHISHEMFLT
tara:strand:+ start:469 stop:948 length:480 start_codon:yes stop_codon:yes gene_type:complete